MEIYSQDARNKKITSDQLIAQGINAVASGTFSSKTEAEGFLPFPNLELLLNQAGCVGIRIYKLGSGFFSSKITCVGVKANGFDLSELYFNAHRHFGTLGDLSQEVEKVNANTLSGRVDTENPLTAFFSKADMENMLTNTDATGVAFYQIGLMNVDDAQLEEHIRVDKANLSTYFALPDKAIPAPFPGEEKLQGPLTADEILNKGLVSDLPCPGHCTNLTLTIAPTPSAPVDESIKPYLTPWEKD